jgi:hypothetical protein
MNHELPPALGAVRAHGNTGSFVSRWTIDEKTLAVVEGRDLIEDVLAPAAGGGWNRVSPQLNRLCSADLAPQSAFHDPATGAGTTARLFLDGEEQGGGRAFATVVDGPDAGSAYRLDSLGKAGWENQVAKPDTGPDTVVVGTDDNTPGQVYVYVGRKGTIGNDVERAGLVGGTLYGVKVAGLDLETDASTSTPGNRFELVAIPGAGSMTQGQLETASNTLGITRFMRPEDSAWDPSDPRGLWMATTASFETTSRLWHLRFDDPTDVTRGGTIEVAVESPPYDAAAPAGPRQMDNLTVNARGQVIVQEDTGNQPYLAGIWQHDPATGGLVEVAHHDPARFLDRTPRFLTESEESSGVIPAPFLGAGKYLVTSMAHYATDAETVEGGQLLLLKVPPGKPVV